jgi:hypothetical protein
VTVNGIRGLAAAAWRVHADAVAAYPTIRVTRPSAPILYFGDLDAYRVSSVRVVTVGVNPSGEEFPADTPWSRFACAETAGAGEPEAAELDDYITVLNRYFRHDPYNRWFKRSYEPVLNGLDGSFYGDAQITALHTDVCSPLATTPTWRFLQKYEQRALAADGVPLWHRLVEELEPHIIFASVKREHFARITLEPLSNVEVIYTVAHERPYHVTVRRVRCGATAALLLWAEPSTTPFQPISDTHKRAVGAAVKTVFYA